MRKIINKYYIVIIGIFLICLSACSKIGPKDPYENTPLHTHSYEEAWSYDLETHYHKANCGHDDLKEGVQNHTYTSGLRCSICGFKLFLYAYDGQAPINLVVGEKVTPYSYHGGIDTDFKYTSSDPSVVKVTENGEVIALKAGTSTITASFRGIEESSVVVNVDAKETINIDTTYLDDLNELLKDFDDVNSISLKAYTEINNQTSVVEVKIQQSPFYYETHIIGASEEEENKLVVIRQEDGKYFKYHDAYRNTISRSYLNDEQLKEEMTDESALFSEVASEFNFSKAQINKISDNHFTIKMYILDSGIDYQTLFGEAGIEIEEALKDSILTFDIERNENIVEIKYGAHIRVNVGYDVVVVPFNLKFQYDFGEITPYDLSAYTLAPPSCFEETLPSSLGSYIEINRSKYSEKAQDNYFKYHLEKGTYVFTERGTLQNSVSNYLEFNVYDSSYNKINTRKELENIDIYKNVLYIEEDGDYYFDIKIPEPIITHLSIKLEKYDSNERTEKEFISDSDNLTNLCDYVKYKYVKENQYELIKFTNTGNNNIYLFMTNGNNSKEEMHLEIKPKETFIINPDLGDNYYYIHTKDSVTYDYEFELEIIPYEDNSSNTNIITDEFNEYYSIGLDLPDYLNHTVSIKDSGLYKFEIKGIYGISDCGLRFLNANGNVSNRDTYISYIEWGDYTVSLNTKYNMDYFQIRYQKIDTSDKEVDLELKELDLTKTYYGHLSSIQNKNMKLTNEQVIKYNFTLDAPTNIIYDPNAVEIYDTNDNLVSLSFTGAKTYSHLMHSIKFASGKYYAICTANMSNSVFVLGYSNEVIDAFDKENTNTLDINEDFSIDIIWSNDARYYKYIPSEDVSITITSNNYNKEIIVFTSDYEKVPFINSQTVNLKQSETYYFLFYANTSMHSTRRYSFEINSNTN